MKEEWKVYIKSVPDRGNEVINALVDLGGKTDVLHSASDDYLYFIRHNGSIDCAYLGSELSKLIMDNYHEIKLPEKWYNGDILINLKTKDFAIYRADDDFRKETFRDIVYVKNNGIFSNYPHRNEDFSLATDEETQQFYKLLHKHGKDWNAEKKQLVDMKCKPAVNDWYWIVTSDGRVNKLLWFDSKDNNRFFNFGNCFKTKEEAKIAAKKIKKLLKGEL